MAKDTQENMGTALIHFCLLPAVECPGCPKSPPITRTAIPGCSLVMVAHSHSAAGDTGKMSPY